MLTPIWPISQPVAGCRPRCRSSPRSSRCRSTCTGAGCQSGTAPVCHGSKRDGVQHCKQTTAVCGAGRRCRFQSGEHEGAQVQKHLIEPSDGGRIRKASLALQGLHLHVKGSEMRDVQQSVCSQRACGVSATRMPHVTCQSIGSNG